VLFLQAWNNERGELDTLAGQQHGVAYVRALQPLIGAVVAAESTAVAGATVNLQPVDRAALAVAAVDQRYGADLRTQVLWADADIASSSCTVALSSRRPTPSRPTAASLDYCSN